MKKNWKLSAQSDERWGTRVCLELSPENMRELSDFLEETLAGKEARLEIESWSFFWKTRPSESRLLLAHPEKDQWVATLALESAHLQSLQERLKDGTSFQLEELFMPYRLSNFALEFKQA